MLALDNKLVELVEDIVVSYENQISAVGAVIDSTYHMLRESEAILDDANSQLRQALASRSSLRRKDFDSMMADLQSQQAEKHQVIRETLNRFVQEHKESAAHLREMVAAARSGEMGDFRKVLGEIQTRQGEAEGKVITLLKVSQEEHEEIVSEVNRLLGSASITAQEFKATLNKLKCRQSQFN
ncbi:MAG: hypothetical protein PHV74_10755 [Dehalococcoidia bacterium]|nr:hypothetical protein [Dehalococcoidia bacterium]